MADRVDELERLVEQLQSQQAFQEDALQQLDQALATQQQEMLQLRRQVEWLKEQQTDLANQVDASPGVGAAQEKPPHY